MLQALDLVVRHHPSMPPVLAGVNLSIRRGETVCVVGGNGSGKSTLARALVGLEPLESGRIAGETAASAPPRVGLVLQDPAAQLIAVTVADELALGPEGAGMPPVAVGERVHEMLARHGIASLQARDPSTLSGGQQQRVAVAAIDACALDVLVLDEPTALLDPAATAGVRAAIRAAVRAHDGGVVWITQEPDDIAWCDRVVVLDAGVVTWDGPREAYVADPALAATWQLELPVAARVAHALAARGAWPRGERVPAAVPDLLRTLAGSVPRG